MSKPVSSALYMTRAELEYNAQELQKNSDKFTSGSDMETYREFLDIFAAQRALLNKRDQKPAPLPGRARALLPGRARVLQPAAHRHKPAKRPPATAPKRAAATLPPGMSLVRIVGDGHCAFRSFATGLERLRSPASTAVATDPTVRLMRGQACEQLKRECGSPTAQQNLVAGSRKTFAQYLIAMEHTNYHGSTDELAALAQVHRVRVEIYNTRGELIHTLNRDATMGTISLQHTGNHFNLLVPSS